MKIVCFGNPCSIRVIQLFNLWLTCVYHLQFNHYQSVQFLRETANFRRNAEIEIQIQLCLYFSYFQSDIFKSHTRLELCEFY